MAGRRHSKSELGGRHFSLPQRGAALLIVLILAVTAMLTYVVTGLTPEAVEARRAQQTQLALMQAREALIGYALKYRDEQIAQGQADRVYGYLPLPDLGTSRNNNTGCTLEGCDAANFPGNQMYASVIGRLPWRTLGLPPLRDGAGECLWYIVSGSHQRQQRVTPMNWDTLGHLDIVVSDGTHSLSSALANAHERPVAVIFSPGAPLPGQQRNPSPTDSIAQCGGNYNAADYLDPATATVLGGITNYLAGANAATTVTGDADPNNDPDTPKSLILPGRLFTAGGNYLPNACQGNDCALSVNDSGLTLSNEMLFAALRKSGHFRGDINTLLDRMANCLRDEIASGGGPSGYARIAGADDNACYGTDTPPRGYYPHYKEMIFVARGPLSVNDTDCAAALLFAGQRAAGQLRDSTANRNAWGNYLENSNLANFGAGTTFSGPEQFERVSAGQAKHQDIVRCIPFGGTFTTVASPKLASLGVGQLATYDTLARRLILGRENVVTGVIGNGNAAALFGCAWMDMRALGSGVRIYFQFRFKKLGTNVGSNGFVFTLADAGNNSLASCGMAGSHLGYSGDNGTTPRIAQPKVGIEFDQGRDAFFPGTAGEAAVNAGRNDPCGTTAPGCAGIGYNSHAAIVYWGNTAANPADGVGLPDNDDNVHGLPATPPANHPPPTNPTYPSTGFAFKDLRGKSGQGGDSYLYHVRVEFTPARNIAMAAEDSHTVLQTRAWLLPHSPTVANQITAMQNTTRPMSQLYASFSPDLQDAATLYDVGTDRGGCDNCQAGELCGTDNFCYRQALQTLRPGFTGAQRTTDQEVHIDDFSATWLP
jgi:type II secretory pathway pseudopilin PulG